MAAYDGTIRIDTAINTQGMNKGVAGLSGSLKGLAVALVGAFSVAAVVAFGKQAIQLASTLQIVKRQFNTVFGDLAPVVRKQMEDLGTATNFCENDLMSFATTLQVAFKGMGLGGQQAANLSAEVVKLGEDLSIFWNKDTASVIGDLQYAMMGMTRGLRAYGITVTDATLKEKARTMGLWDGVGALSAAAKAQATLAIVQEQASYAQGAAIASTNTWAGQIRGITIAWEDFYESLGSGFITALQGLLPVVTWLLGILNRVATTFYQLMAILFGLRVEIPAVSDGIGGMAGGAGELADNTAAAGKAAKGALAAFDQLNVLQQDQGGAGSIPITGTISMPEVNMANFTQSVGWIQARWNALVEAFRLGQEIIKNLLEYPIFSAWWDWMSQIGQYFWDLIRGDFAGAWEHLKNVWALGIEFLKLAWGGIWSWIIETIGPWCAMVVTGVQNWFSQLWTNITTWAANALINIQAWWNGLPSWAAGIVTGVQNWFRQLWDNIKLWAASAWEAIRLVWSVVKDWFNINVIDPLSLAFTTALLAIETGWENTFTGIKEFVRRIINTIIGFVNGMISGVISGINAVINGMNRIRVTIPSWVPKPYGGSTWGMSIPNVSAPQVPYMAQGAVIPPNAAFMAVLGDQRAGRNLEAPEGLIRQIVREETQGLGGDITVRFEGTLAALIRELQPVIERENRRIGTSLIVGGVA